jgi:DNA-binding CsgD family transcriptional regulator
MVNGSIKSNGCKPSSGKCFSPQNQKRFSTKNRHFTTFRFHQKTPLQPNGSKPFSRKKPKTLLNRKQGFYNILVFLAFFHYSFTASKTHTDDKGKKQETEVDFNPSQVSLILHHDPQLTDRELEVFNLLKLGFSTKLITEVLNIKANTVNTHRKSIIFKLRAENICHAVSIGFANNLLSAQPK